MDLLQIALCFFVIWGIRSLKRWCTKYISYRKGINKFSGPEIHPIFGNLHQHPGMTAEGLSWFLESGKKYGQIWRIWFGPFLGHLQVNHFAPLRDLFSSEKTASKAMGIPGYGLVVPWIGEGLITSNGPVWFRNRRLLTPAFHFGVLKPYVEKYNVVTDVLIDNLSKFCGNTSSHDISNYVGLATLDSLLRCLVSYEDESIQLSSGCNHPYVHALEELGRLTIKRGFNPLHWSTVIYFLTKDGRDFKRHADYVHKFAENLIKMRRMTVEEEKTEKIKRHLDFLDILLNARDDDGKGLTDVEIRYQVDTFLFAGHDTTTSSVCWMLYSLAKHPQWQDKVRTEVKAILEGRNSPEITWDDIGKLNDLSLVTKEMLRFHTPAPVISRMVQSDTTVGQFQVRAGTHVELRLYDLHHNPDVWGEDCMEFKPERFLTKEVEKMDPFAYAPFSAGSRNCIGKNFALNEIKVITARLINKFHFRVDPANEPIYKPEIVMRSANGFQLFIDPVQ